VYELAVGPSYGRPVPTLPHMPGPGATMQAVSGKAPWGVSGSGLGNVPSYSMSASPNDLYSSPRTVKPEDERHPYHAMDIPGYGPVLNPLWDLRGSESDYLGHVTLAGKRVLEIGPATGYLSFYMESQGAEVVSVELSPDVSWDVVPDPDTELESWSQARRAGMEGLRNSYWFAHERFESRAKVHYGNVYHLPDELGHFDLAVMGSVLLHVRDPLGVVESCARLADALVITEPLHPDLPSDRPAMEWFAPRGEPTPDIWWRFSPEIIRRFVEAVGRTSHRTSPLVTTAIVDGSPAPAPMFTVVAWRPDAESPLTP